MSASREKQKRKELSSSGVETKEIKLQNEKKKSQNKTILYTAIGVAFVIIFVLLLVLNSNSYMERKTAATVGDENVSVVDFDYYYRGAINNYANYFGDAWSSYSAHFSPDSFVSTALATAQNTAILTDAAEAEGFQISNDGKAQIDSTLAYYEAYAKQAGFGSTDAFIETNFGKGCSADSYRAWLEDQVLASEYSAQKRASYTYTQDDLTAYYNENPNDFDQVTYRYFFLSSAATEEMDAEAAAAWASETAQSMADQSVGNETVFNGLCIENSDEETAALYEDEDYSLVSNALYSGTNTAYADWLFDAARQAGDTTAVEGTSGWYVVYFLDRVKPDYNMVNVRHILLSVEDGADEAAKAEVQAQAEALLDEWQNGVATEETFASLADANSADGAEGGLYENVYKGQMVAEFEDWCFDPARQSGDTGIVETSYGYHVMYFVSEGDAYLPWKLEETKRAADYNDWIGALVESYPTAVNDKGLSKCNLTVTQ